MHTDYLKTFLNVVENGSFSKTADLLYLSKQAIMNQMNRLEKETGVRLFDKSQRGVRLTKEGAVFARWAAVLIEDEQKMLDELRESASKMPSIRLASIDYHVLLKPVTEVFRQRYPEVQIENVFHYETLEARLVAKGIIDVGDTLSLTSFDKEKLCYEKLLHMPYFCILPKPYSGKRISLHELSRMSVAVDRFEYKDEYVAHLDILKHEIPHLDVIESDKRRIDVVYSVLGQGKVFITAATYARTIKEFSIADLDIDLARECGIIYSREAGIEVKNYVDIAHEVYG